MPGCQKKLCRHKYQVLYLNAVPNLSPAVSGQAGGTAQHITRGDMAQSACLGFLNQIVIRQRFKLKSIILSLTLIDILSGFSLTKVFRWKKKDRPALCSSHLIWYPSISSSVIRVFPHLISRYCIIWYQSISLYFTKLFFLLIQKYFLIWCQSISLSHIRVFPHLISEHFHMSYHSISSYDIKIFPHLRTPQK